MLRTAVPPLVALVVAFVEVARVLPLVALAVAFVGVACLLPLGALVVAAHAAFPMALGVACVLSWRRVADYWWWPWKGCTLGNWQRPW